MSNNYCTFIRIRVFSYEHDDAKKVFKSFLRLIPLKLNKKDFSFELSTAEGFDNDEILILTFRTERPKVATAILNHIFSNLSKQDVELLIKQLDTRVENSQFFLRLDKDALQNDNFVITETGNCYHVKAIIPSFPASSENTVKLLESILNDFLANEKKIEEDKLEEIMEENFSLITSFPEFSRFKDKKDEENDLYIKDTGSFDFMP